MTNYAAEATKTLKRAVPTINEDGKVLRCDIEVEYELNEYKSSFNRNVKIEPVKAPSEYTKSELWTIMEEQHLDTVFSSQYESVVVAPTIVIETIADFDVDSLN